MVLSIPYLPNSGFNIRGKGVVQLAYLDPSRDSLIDMGLKSLIKWSMEREQGGII